MRLKYQKGKYYLQLKKLDEQLILEGWEFEGEGIHSTYSSVLADKYCIYADVETLNILWERNQRRQKSFSQGSTKCYIAPEGKSYMPYQQAGIEYSLGNGVTLIADEMGLGKTIQAIGIVNNSDAQKVLVVCPAFLKYNWHREMGGWLTKQIHLEVLSYAKLKDATGHYDLVIFDEAHYLKNEEAKRTQYGMSIDADKWLFLTGTPILSRPIELWTMLSKAGYDLPKKEFELRYCGGKLLEQWTKRNGRAVKKKIWFNKGSDNLKELGAELRGIFMIRRLKADVLKDLPDKVRQVVQLDVKGYKEVLPKDIDKYNKKVKLQTCSKIRHQTALKKLPLCIEYINNAMESEEPLLIFAYHLDVIEELASKLKNCETITGGTSQKGRDEALERFKSGESRILIGQINACGVGLTITNCNQILFVETVWSPSILAQAEDRCHRIGQERTVFVQYLVMGGSLDAYMMDALVRKRMISSKLLDDEFDWEDIVKDF